MWSDQAAVVKANALGQQGEVLWSNGNHQPKDVSSFICKVRHGKGQ
jgi:hypothetical protein